MRCGMSLLRCHFSLLGDFIDMERGHTSQSAGSSLTKELVWSGISCSGTPVRIVNDTVGNSAVTYRAASTKSSSANLSAAPISALAVSMLSSSDL